jgi:hypothetical protein
MILVTKAENLIKPILKLEKNFRAGLLVQAPESD